MMNTDNILNDIPAKYGLWCAMASAGTDLAAAGDFAVAQKMAAVSVGDGAVATLWPWLERTGIKIMPRFYWAGARDAAATGEISELSARINAAFKVGAHGAQIFMRAADIATFAEQIAPVRDDLFFNKDLSIGVDIMDVDAADWEMLYANLRRIRAMSVVFALSRDAGAKSDFVGRIYAMLDMFDKNYSGDFHFAFGKNIARIEQTWRLVREMHPDISGRVMFFVNH